MKTQKELGAVHLLIEGLDKERFKKLVEGHEIVCDTTIEDELEDTLDGVEYYFIENSYFAPNYKWVSTDSVDENSKLITLDELEKLLGKERTPEVIQAEIDKLQDELSELTKIKVGDVVISGKGHIFRCEGYDNSTHQALSAHIWHWDCTKIDPNKTVKEILGL